MRYISTNTWRIPPEVKGLFRNPRSLVIRGSVGSPVSDMTLNMAKELSREYNVFYFSFRGKKPPFKFSGKKIRKRNISTHQLDFFILKHSPDDIRPLYGFSSLLPKKSIIFVDDFDELVLSFRMKGDDLKPEEILYLFQRDMVEDSNLSIMLHTTYGGDEIYRIADMVMDLNKVNTTFQDIRVARVISSLTQDYLISHSDGEYLFHSPGEIRESKYTKLMTIIDKKGFISTGIPDLDHMLGGGFKPGSYNVFEVSSDVLNEVYRPLIYTMAVNSLKNGRGVLIAPAESSSSEDYFHELKGYLNEIELPLLKILMSTPLEEKKPWFVDGYSQSVDGRFEIWKMIMEHLKKISNGCVMDITEYGAIESTFSKNDLIRLVSQGVKWMSEWGSVGIGVVSEESEVKDKLMYLSHRYLKIKNINSIYCIEGIKPPMNPRIIDIIEKRKGLAIKLRRII